MLGLWAQWRVKSTYAAAQQMPAPLSGAAAARHILDSGGLRNVEIEQIPGQLTDHYDPKAKVLRLSPEVYQGRNLAAVGIAAHESGHACKMRNRIRPLVVRNAAVPVANFGSGISYILILAGFFLQYGPLLWAGIALFGGVVFFQLVNLPVEFNASSRAKAQLVDLGIINNEELHLRRQSARRGRLDVRGRHAANRAHAACTTSRWAIAAAAISVAIAKPQSGERAEHGILSIAARADAPAASTGRRRRCWRRIAG